MNDKDENGVTRFLLMIHSAKNGIELKAADNSGCTEFILACQKGHNHVVKLVDKYLTKLLLKNGFVSVL